MKTQLIGLSCALVVLAISSVVEAQSKKIDRSALPPAVEMTVSAQTQGATVKGFSTEVEYDKRIYEVAMTVNGHARSVEIDEHGVVLETEDEVPMSALPPAVKAALTKAAGNDTIEKVETLSKKGRLVAYEANVKTGTKRSEIQVGPDGQKLAHPE